MNNFVKSIGGAVLSPFLTHRAFWAVKLKNGTLLSERDSRKDARFPGGVREVDWYLDLVANGDVANIRELWLICPPNRMSPFGNTAKFDITEPYTCFQMKTASFDALGANGTTFEGLIIGKVDDKVSGDCTFFVWDNVLKAMSVPQKGNVYTGLPSWREGIADVRNLSFDVLGLRL